MSRRGGHLFHFHPPESYPDSCRGHVSESPGTQQYWKRGAAALLVALALLAVAAILATRIRSTFRPKFFQLLVGVAALGLLLRVVAYVVAARTIQFQETALAITILRRLQMANASSIPTCT